MILERTLALYYSIAFGCIALTHRSKAQKTVAVTDDKSAVGRYSPPPRVNEYHINGIKIKVGFKKKKKGSKILKRRNCEPRIMRFEKEQNKTSLGRKR